MKNKKYLSPILAGTIFVAILLLDLLTKEFIIKGLIPNVGDAVDVFPKFINFVYVKNTGAAWGMLAGRPIFLIVISLLVLGLLLAYYILRIKKLGGKTSVLFGISVGLIVGGCLGNMIDRIFLGYVRDFINFQFMNFPVFNFADVALTIGTIIMLVYFLFFFSKEEEKLKKQNSLADDHGQENISLSNVTPLEAPSQEEGKQDASAEEGEENER